MSSNPFCAKVFLLSAIVLAGCIGSEDGSEPKPAKIPAGWSGWHQQTPWPEENFHLSVVFLDGKTGYGLNVQGGIDKTTDGGVTWKRMRDKLSEETSLTCRDIANCAVIENDGEHLDLIVTKDGGTTWQVERAEFEPVEIRWLSEGKMIALLREANGFMQSEDAGHTWSRIDVDSNVHIVEATYLGKNTGLALGIPLSDSDSSLIANIYRTEDGGMSWERKYSYPIGAGEDLFKCPKLETCFIYGGEGILATKDGGDSWEKLPGVAGMEDFSCVGATACLAILPSDDAVKLVSTVDGCRNWKTRPLGLDTRYVRDVFFLNEKEIWALNYSGAAWRSTDGGLTWTPQFSQDLGALAPVNINSLAFVDENTGFASLVDGGVPEFRILKTTNGGRNWSVVFSVPDENKPATIVAAGSGNIYAVRTNKEERGVILSSKDNGKTWNKQEFEVQLEHVECIDNNTCMASGLGGVLKTEDGTTWEEAFSTGMGFGEIDCPKKNLCYAIAYPDGDGKWRIYQISNGILRIDSPILEQDETLNSLSFVNEQVGFVRNSDSTVLKTTDGGSNWSAIALPEELDRWGTVRFLSEQTAFAISRSIYKTADGGLTWVEQTPGYRGELNSITCPSRNTCYAAGWEGDVLRTNTAGVR